MIAAALPALITQYVLIYFAATSAHTRMSECIPRELGGYKEAYHGWDQGVCFTEEQLWCRAHPGKHPACETADCRAEEVRLSLPGRNGYRDVSALMNDYGQSASLREPVWNGCSSGQLQAIWNRFKSNKAWQGACVPFGDKRSMLLRYCQVRMQKPDPALSPPPIVASRGCDVAHGELTASSPCADRRTMQSQRVCSLSRSRTSSRSIRATRTGNV